VSEKGFSIAPAGGGKGFILRFFGLPGEVVEITLPEADAKELALDLVRVCWLVEGPQPLRAVSPELWERG